MKEASGEANLTVVTIILIGVIVAVVTPLITSLMGNTQKRTCCANAGGKWNGTTCTSNGNSGYIQADYNSCISAGDK